MRNIIVYLFVITILGVFPISIKAQQKMDSSKVYIHNEKVSFKAQFFQGIASIFGVKKLIEKNINKGKYNQDVARMPKSLKNNFDITEDIKKGKQVWTLKPKKNISKKVILYLHGGAYYWNISQYNWSITEQLLTTTNATFVVPDYPLAPQATCEQVYDFIDALYQELVTKYDSEDIIIMGESAGGGLALGFAMSLRNEKKRQPNQLILLAPWLDVTMSNSDILDIDKKDKILGIKGLQMAGKGYAGELGLKNYKVSPIYGDLSGLTKISIFVGTHDLFMADAKKLRKKAEQSDVFINYFEYPKMFHIWILLKKLKEAQSAVEQITTLIKS